MMTKATDKQIDLLYRLNADFNAELIEKGEATLIISKLLYKKEEENKIQEQVKERVKEPKSEVEE